ncbi:hypothetical protein B0H10DRAFT_779146 [Mycena sp. CBHHK59/15]|nr:hypothetical protein B0H10DRAFT_779146 [Mycena sp. CBHHK59/15]
MQYSFIHQLILVTTQILVCIVMILRTYAFYGRNRRLLWMLVVIGVCLTAVCVWTVLGQRATAVKVLPGCHLGVSVSTGYHLAASWEALLLFDSIIFGLTIYQSYSARRRVGVQARMPLHTLIMRDGAMYFAAMVLANLTNIITYYVTGPLLRGSMSTFANCVSVSMMSRLMLNLHEKAGVGILTQLNASQFPDDIPLSVSVVRTDNVINVPPMPDTPSASTRAIETVPSTSDV